MDIDFPAETGPLARLQERLAAATPPEWRPDAGRPDAGPLRLGGCFTTFPRGRHGAGAPGDPGWAGAALVVEEVVVSTVAVAVPAGAPYEAGYLAAREGPLLLAAVRALPERPDVLLVNATGRDHPRRAGLALHLGAALDLPSVGVTHRPLWAVGDWPDDEPGATSPLYLEGDIVGAWLRPHRGLRPLAVHTGWRTTLETALDIVRASLGRDRTPVPIRDARRAAREARAGKRPGVPGQR